MTSRSAVECSATELYPRSVGADRLMNVLLLDLKSIEFNQSIKKERDIQVVLAVALAASYM